MNSFAPHPPRTAQEHAARRAILARLLSHGTPDQMNAFVEEQRRRAMAARTQPKWRGILKLIDIAK